VRDFGTRRGNLPRFLYKPAAFFLYIASDEALAGRKQMLQRNGSRAQMRWQPDLDHGSVQTRPKQKSRISEGYVKGAGRRAGLYFPKLIRALWSSLHCGGALLSLLKCDFAEFI
jgi:hypothetical protein